jgi:tRNA/rRNA methyltransferase
LTHDSSAYERHTPAALHQADPLVLERVTFVLVGTSHPGNVGSAARAMKTMGLSDLRLVHPRFADVCQQPEAIAFASGATDRLQTARIFPQLADALADCAMAVAVSAESREFGPVPQPPEAAARAALEVLHAHEGHRVAFVFGPERTGLSIESVQACAQMLSIPASPLYSSLNLAQALQVVAYVLRREALGAVGSMAATATADASMAASSASWPASWPASFAAALPAERLADQRAVQGLLEHLERASIAVGFLDPAHPKKLMPRLARLLQRARLSPEEVDLLRGLCKRMEQPIPRAQPPDPVSGQDQS